MSALPDDLECMRVTAEMASALQPHVAVKMLMRDETLVSKSREGLRARGVDVDAIEFLVDPLAAFMIRDPVVFLMNGQGELGVLDLRWNLYGLEGWVQRFTAEDPERLARAADYLSKIEGELDQNLARSLNAPLVPSSLFLEGGAIEVNGRGVLLINEPVALGRNLGRGRAELEDELLLIPGVSKVIWLGEGLAQDPWLVSTIDGDRVGMGSGGHVDEFVRFADANTLLLSWIEEDRVGEHSLNRINRSRLQEAYDILASSTDQDGRPFRIIKVPLPAVIEKPMALGPREEETNLLRESSFPQHEGRQAGDRVVHVAAASYLNLVIANDLVLVPSYVEDGTPAAVQDLVRSALQSAFPRRTIRFIHATPLNWMGGGMHCATLSEPRTG